MLRQFRTEDIGTVKQLIDTTIDASYGDVYPPNAIEFFKEYHSLEQIRKDAADGYTIVLEVAGRIIGTGTLLGSEIRRMFVAPDVQRAGFGRRLLDALEEKARESGLENVELFASLVARPFYERMGFRVVRESCVPLRDGQRLDCFVMTKGLRVGECGMQEYVVDFGSTPWASPAPGMRFKAAELGHRKLRFLELAREFMEEDWCTKGHVGYVLEGEIEIDFDGTTVRARAGDGILIPPGTQSKHKARVVSPTARLILVEDA